MCTAVLSIEAGGPVLLAGVRDELTERAWEPPGRHWPDYPALIGGRDLLAGGTWLAVAPAPRRVACVLNGRGRPAPARFRRSRGALPLLAAAEAEPKLGGLEAFDPFHLLTAEPDFAILRSWDGERFTERELTAGLHVVVNSGLGSDLLAGDAAGSGRPRRQPGQQSAENAHELARVAHFLPRFRAAIRPVPRPGIPVGQAWGAWLPLVNGDGIPAEDPRALIVWRDLGAGRIWGTTSISLVAVSPEWVRYDFTGAPGEASAWWPVPMTP